MPNIIVSRPDTRPVRHILAMALLAGLVASGCATTGPTTIVEPFSRDPARAATRPLTRADSPCIFPVADSHAVMTLPFGVEHNGHPHGGVDFAVPQGTPVLAAADGVVYFAGEYHNYGRLVRIAHRGGIQTLYAHLHSFSVHEGMEVKQGQQIGCVGSTGNSTGPHLHYEIRVANRQRDPVPFMQHALRPGADAPSAPPGLNTAGR